MNDAISVKRISSPIGELILGVGRGGCRLIEFADRSDARRSLAGRPYNLRVSDADHALLRRVESELAAFFAGSTGASRAPAVPLDLRGTSFQVAVWQALLRIPHGETRSYGEIADAVGNPAAVRGGRQRSRPQPGLLAGAVPPGRTDRGRFGRLWRGAVAQAVPARTGGSPGIQPGGLIIDALFDRYAMISRMKHQNFNSSRLREAVRRGRRHAQAMRRGLRWRPHRCAGTT